MTTQIIRHTSYNTSSGVNFVGGGSLGDQSDSSWAQHIGSSQTWTVSNMADYTLASDERCASLTLLWRADSGFGAVVSHLFPGGASAGQYDNWNDVSSLADRAGQVRNSTPGGGEWDQSAINGLLVWVLDDGFGGTKPRVTEVWASLDIRHKPTSTQSAPVGTNPGTTRRPISVWATDAKDGESQTFFQVAYYNQAQYTAGGFTPFVSTAVLDTGVQGGSVTNYTPTADLPDGSYRAYVRSGKTFRSAAWWADTTFTSFTINDTPGLPTAITPADGATVQTDLPTLAGHVNTSGLSSPAHIEFNLATNNTFSANLRVATTTTNVVSGDVSIALVNANRLFQGLWYVRARAVDATGKTSGWTSYTSLTVSHPASATNLTPTGDISLTYPSGGITPLDWDFADPAPEGDSQTAYQFIVERADTGATVVDSGKVTSTATAATVTISAGLKDIPLRWRIRLYDTDDKTAGYSANQLFRVSDVPAIVITEPDLNDSVNTAFPVFTWTTTLPAGRTQTHFRPIITEIGSSIVRYDPGFISGAVQTYTMPVAVLRNGVGYSLTIQVKDNTGLIGQDTIAVFTARWNPPVPISPDVFVGDFDTHGYVALFWNQTPDPYLVRYNIYRRGFSVDWDLIGTILADDRPDHVYQDRLVATDTNYTYAVTQVALRFGQEVESAKPDEERVFNGHFELGLGGWTTSTPADVTLLASGGANGGQCIQIADTDGTGPKTLVADVDAPFNDFPVSGGSYAENQEKILVFFYWKPISGDKSYYVKIYFNGANPVILQGTDTDTANWHSVEQLITVPIGATYAGFEIAACELASQTSTTRFDGFHVTAYADPVLPVSHAYWLVDQTAGVSLRLSQTTGDSFTDEYEEDTQHLIGRGRHVEFGDRLGYSGTLSGQFWDGYTGNAREQRLTLEALKMERNQIYLRNPFGDIFKVSLGDIQVDRMPGVGQNEYGTYSIPYEEVI